MKETIFTKIQDEIEEFNTEYIDITEDWSFNQKDTLNRIDDYYNSKFTSGDTDSEGFKKHFYNISKYRVLVSSKATDLDTKDVNIKASDGQSYYPAWFFEKDLKQWMKDNFAKFLNDVKKNRPKYGTVVVKKVRKDGELKLELVPLKNLIVDQGADSLEEMGFVIEEHTYTQEELRKQKWDKGLIEDAIELAEKKNEIKVYERYGYVPAEWLGGYEGDYVKARSITCGEDEDEGVEFELKEVEEIPYWECHWHKIPGRWLGVGVVEDLFEEQVRMNELTNLKSKGLNWSALHIFQTRDDLIKRNLLQDARNGDVINANSEITQIDTADRNLASFNQEETRWDSLADQKTFSYDLMRGERPPAGTPLGTSVLQSQMIGGYFDDIREDFGLFLKKLIREVIIPEFKKTHSHKHTINLLGENPDELAKYDELIKTGELNKRMMEFLDDKGYLPDVEQMRIFKEMITEDIRENKNRYKDIPKGFYDDLKYDIDIIITGEKVDLAAKMQTLNMVLMMLAQNPTILKDPTTKRVFFKLIDLAGISPTEFMDTEAPPLEEDMNRNVAEQGGSLAKAPAITPTATTMPTEAKI